MLLGTLTLLSNSWSTYLYTQHISDCVQTAVILHLYVCVLSIGVLWMGERLLISPQCFIVIYLFFYMFHRCLICFWWNTCSYSISCWVLWSPLFLFDDKFSVCRLDTGDFPLYCFYAPEDVCAYHANMRSVIRPTPPAKITTMCTKTDQCKSNANNNDYICIRVLCLRFHKPSSPIPSM